MVLRWIRSNNAELRRLAKGLAVLDAILMPEWELRYHSFDAHWARGQQLASMRNGSGEHYFVLFVGDDAVIKGFVKDARSELFGTESDRLIQAMESGLPDVFLEPFVREPAFLMQETSFVYWRLARDGRWRTLPGEGLDRASAGSAGDGEDRGPVENRAESADEELDRENGAERLLEVFAGRPETYRSWAASYFQKTISLESIAAVYAGEPLTRALVESINSAAGMGGLEADLAEIGYPPESVPFPARTLRKRSDTEPQG